jgi:formylglycine-generating enzyme required for sulfatase activity/serine/threonine protein kinase
MALHALQSGYMLREYRLEKLLGEGGFGLTYLAIDTNLDKKVAIKEYMPSEHAIRESDSKIIAKSDSSTKVYNWGLNAFINEAKILAKFEDPNIVRVHRFFKANGTAYIVMEYCEGGCLIDRISKHKHMPEAELRKLISSLANGLQLVHNDGILHRDIKPDNIMFRLDDTPVLIDFGAARQAIGTKSRKVTTIITPGYAPLEQYSSEGTIGPWSDIYSLAAVAYLCLTGKRPPDIMNRLHEDKVTKLGERVNSSLFLKSIDSGLELQIKNRPQSLSEWSASWDKHKINKKPQDTVEIEVVKQRSHAPIYANNPRHTNRQETVRRPISARPKVDSIGMTKINKNYKDLAKKKGKEKKVSVMRIGGLFLIFIGLIAIGFVSYELYLKNTKNNNQLIVKNEDSQKIENQEQAEPTIAINENNNTDKKSIIEVQQLLNKLGYNVSEAGKLDIRTIESIKTFEEKKNLIVTGTIDSILIDELKNAWKVTEEKAWEVAKNTNTTISFSQFIDTYPTSQYAVQVPSYLVKIKAQARLTLDQENQKLADLEKLQQEQSRLNQINEVKRQLIKNIQTELKRLKFSQLKTDGTITQDTKSAIIAYQKLKKSSLNGLPTKTLLYQLKLESKWPGRVAGEIIKDCQECPTMLVIPAGQFIMGSNKGKANEKPPHFVKIDEFILSQTEVTFNQWDACVADKVCLHNPRDEMLGRDNLAVMNVNWHDIQLFLKWLNSKSQRKYRLPSEAEWEYAARAGTTTAYFWGDEIGSNNASCIGCNTGIDRNKINQVKNHAANAFGLYDMHGNVWEWTADCWHSNYSGAPSDGEAWEPTGAPSDGEAWELNGCKNFVVRGGSGGNSPEDLRSASRGVKKSTQRLNSIGFRVALDSD